jgi:LysM repeat protein
MKLFQKLPKLALNRKRPKKMRATVGRRPLRAATANYDEMAEPNMKLSRALLIVLLLHVVAVSGIIAFNAIKTRQGPSLPRVKNSTAAKASLTDGSPIAQGDDGKTGEIRKARAIGKDGAGDHGKTAEVAHKTYNVAKGDSPASIAKKFKVSQDELLALNHIDDPRKLKIGQKLLIPTKAVRAKKGANEN